MDTSTLARLVAPATALLFVFGTQAYADQIIASTTGLSGPAETIDFSEIVLPMDTQVTNQYASRGVTFSPEVFYSPFTDVGNIQGQDVGDFSFFRAQLVNPVTLSFSLVQSGVAFSFEADGTYLFQAFLGGSLVDSFTSTVGFLPAGPTPDFYGFSNESFDSITITNTGGATPFWVASNIELSSAPVIPEPSSALLLGTALLGLTAVLRRIRA